MQSFILRGRKKLPPEDGPSGKHIYDLHRQIWIDCETAQPVITGLQTERQSSKFGETTLTETREGADQREIAEIAASQFGETTMTKTSESADQEIVSLSPTKFGETMLTSTIEGADQREIATLSGSQFGETSLTRTHEGLDQTEASHAGEPRNLVGETTAGNPALSDAAADAPNSHF